MGYSNTLGLVGGLCSIDYGFALMLTSVAVLATDGTWTPSDGVVYAVFLACVICHGILASSFSKVMGKLQTAFVVMNFVLIFATIIALPIPLRAMVSGRVRNIITMAGPGGISPIFSCMAARWCGAGMTGIGSFRF